MARYTDVPDEIKIQSEMIEPAMSSIYGRLFAQTKYMEDTYGVQSDRYADALEHLWYAARCMCELTSLCLDAHHASRVAMNHLDQIDKYIYNKLGFFPKYSEEKMLPFRRYVTGEEKTCPLTVVPEGSELKR